MSIIKHLQLCCIIRLSKTVSFKIHVCFHNRELSKCQICILRINTSFIEGYPCYPFVFKVIFSWIFCKCIKCYHKSISIEVSFKVSITIIYYKVATLVYLITYNHWLSIYARNPKFNQQSTKEIKSQ